MAIGSLVGIPLINICPDDGTGKMLVAHGLNISNYQTIPPQNVHLNPGDALYVLNPSPRHINRYGGLPGLPKDLQFEVVRYTWQEESVKKRREIDSELFTEDDARKLIAGMIKKPKQVVPVQTKTLYLPAGRIDMKHILDKRSVDKVFFTADTHFSDPRILYHRKKYFSSLEEMDRALIDNWNATVPEDGVVFHLGDFGYGSRLLDIAKTLHGTKYIIAGNHDIPKMFASREMQEDARCIPLGREQVMYVRGRRLFLCHYPYLCYEGEYVRTIQLFGHVHSGQGIEESGFDHPRLQYLLPYQYDVGVDNNELRPISLPDILKKFPYDSGPRIERGEMNADMIDEVQAIATAVFKENVSDGKPALWMDRDYSFERLQSDIDQGYAHTLRIRDEVVGYFAVVPADKVSAIPIVWKESTGPSCYIQRLLRASGFNGGTGVSMKTAHKKYKDIRILIPKASEHLQSRIAQHLFECVGTFYENGTMMVAYQRVFP